MRQVLSLFVVTWLLMSLCSRRAAAQAACTAIDSPTPDYLVGTDKCSLGMPGDTTAVCKDSGANTEATFSNTLSVLQVPDTWPTWSDPPDSESSTPRVAFNMTDSLTVTLADGYQAGTAGMEIENNVFEPALPITVVFRNLNRDPLLTITRDVLGRAGARLFAATCEEELVNSMVITAQPEALGFAIAQVRSDSFVINLEMEAPSPVGPHQVPESAKSNARIR